MFKLQLPSSVNIVVLASKYYCIIATPKNRLTENNFTTFQPHYNRIKMNYRFCQLVSWYSYIVWSKMIRNCHRKCTAQSILDKCWKCQPYSSNGTPVWSDCAKAVAWTPTQLVANTLRAARTATLMSNECWSVLEVSTVHKKYRKPMHLYCAIIFGSAFCSF